MSADLQWMIIRKNNSHLIKRNGLWLSTIPCKNQHLQTAVEKTEPNNLKGRHAFRFNGLIHKKTVGIEACKDGKGIVFVTRKTKKGRHPAAAFNRVDMKKDPRRTLTAIRKTLSKNKYRRDLKMAAMRKASAVIRSQRPLVKKAGRKKKE